MLFLQLFLYAAVASAACHRRSQPYGAKVQLQKGAAQRQSGTSSTSTTTGLGLSTPSTGPIAAASPAANSADSYSPSSGGLSASFTQYGGCNVPLACGTLPGGYIAAVSENLFGAGPGQGAGPRCGKCYSLSSSTPGTNTIKVTVNNLCPADGNTAMCAQKGLSGTNSVGANVNFDLCIDNGSADAFFGTAGSRMTTGTASEVPC